MNEERGYDLKRQHEDGWRGAVKQVPSLGKEIIVDIATFAEDYPFEGKEHTLNFDLALDHNVTKRVAGSRITVPSRSLLLLYKSKAAWDRAYRLHEGPPSAWERSKLVKDRSDLLALTDDEHVEDGWDLGFLRDQLESHSFLLPVLEEAWGDEDARERYRGFTAGRAREQMERLLEHLDFR